MIPQLRHYLLENWSSLPLRGLRPRELAFVVQATGVSKVCCFIFAGGENEPRWIAKMPRSPRDNAVIKYEYSLVKHLREHASEYVRETVPGPLLVMEIAGHVIGIERYIQARPMDGLLAGSDRSEKSMRHYLDLACDWLLRSQQETVGQQRCMSESQIQTYLFEPITTLQAESRLSEDERAYLGRLAERVSQLKRLPLPLVFKHGDFRPGNILVKDSGIQVIDWEFGAATALPLMDVFGLLARTYAIKHDLEEIDGYLEDYLSAFNQVFLEGGSFSELTLDYVSRACIALNVDPEWIEVLLAMFLITEANTYRAFLNKRAEQGYVYLLRSRDKQLEESYSCALARQKNVWLLGHLARNEAGLVFHRLNGKLPRQHEVVSQDSIT